MNARLRHITAYLAVTLVAAVAGCGLDGGLKPLESRIEGSISFAGEWPDDLAEIRVVTYEDYPPAAFSDLVAWSDPLPMGVAQLDYQMPLPPGRYALAVVAGRFLDTGWTPLSEYNTAGTVPDTIMLATRRAVYRHVDFDVQFISGEGGISGRIILLTPWVDTVSTIRVGALRNAMTDPPYPNVIFSDVNNLSGSFSRASESYDYSIPLAPGVYRTVAVSWMSYDASGNAEDWVANGLKILTRPVLGVYSVSDPGSLSADSVVVAPDTWLTGVDVYVDFTRVAE